MRFTLRRHQARVLTGAEARAFIMAHEPGHIHWATTVAACSCGWYQTALHGQQALERVGVHKGARVEVA